MNVSMTGRSICNIASQRERFAGCKTVCCASREGRPGDRRVNGVVRRGAPRTARRDARLDAQARWYRGTSRPYGMFRFLLPAERRACVKITPDDSGLRGEDADRFCDGDFRAAVRGDSAFCTVSCPARTKAGACIAAFGNPEKRKSTFFRRTPAAKACEPLRPADWTGMQLPNWASAETRRPSRNAF